ncbi:hypothetical protein [Usitatibacter palustris]|uniref:Outer membrane protein beta-barrel domain-containing protein n=1 Tax=Usitatibacter palustris TaxID=2732487 RepID=A0A6M4HCY4_9PROT|nr:hypothetical protein [Usitatibacter palustris]QJR16935.1 hypothetical protein DSM104440_03772 [Usitatibacter palustris]
MHRWLAVPMFLAASSAAAGDFSSITNLTQDQFRRLSEDLGAAAAYKGVAPATPLGLVGFDLGFVLTSTNVENSSLFALAGEGSQSEILVPKLQIHKGLMAGLDIGAFIGAMPDLGATVYGADLSWAFVDDTLTTPAVAARVSGSITNGLGIDVATVALDAMISKKFAMVTPYVGAGVVRVQSKADGGFSEEKFNQGRVFAGLNVNLSVINLAFEAEKMGDNTSLSAKLGWRF